MFAFSFDNQKAFRVFEADEAMTRDIKVVRISNVYLKYVGRWPANF